LQSLQPVAPAPRIVPVLDVIEPTTDLLPAVEAWQPDAVCVAAGKEYAALMLRCFAAAGLSNGQIAQRLLDMAEVSIDVDTPERRSAADAVARHCAIMDMPLRHVIAVLAYLAAEVPGWPDANQNAAIAQTAVVEFA
jgi:hypothetical protein